MELYRSLFEMAKMLLSELDIERTAELLLRRVVEETKAHRGFIITKTADNSYEQKFDVHYDRERVSADERRFSRGLIREALESQQLIECSNLLEDPRFNKAESALRLEH